jgi:crossover junction endodeoxyribonuclease RusA
MSGVVIELPFPVGALSGHNTGHWRAKTGAVAKHREWARIATTAAWGDGGYDLEGDIRISVTFYPPDRRGDRTNFPNRMKPYWDGIADALKVNDRRFLPSYHFAEPVKDARVVVVIGQ